MSALADRLATRTLGLCHAAREAGLVVTSARAIDVFRALANIDCEDPEQYRLALRLNLVSSREDEILFERVYARYFGAEREAGAGDYILAKSEFIRGELPAGRANEAHRDMLSEADSFAAEEVNRRANLASRWDADAPPLAAVIRELARRLATRPSRRSHPARHGACIDLRRSMRRASSTGFDFLELARSERKLRKTRIVMLCDVSGSMDAFNPFLLQLMFGLQQALKSSRTLVFSTRTSDITAALRRRSIADTLTIISASVRHWSGGTDIGAALGVLNRGVLREGSARSTVLVVISDGYDNGAPARIAAELEAARRQVRRVVWINPMFGASTFTVRAAGMRAALPYVDHFLPAFNGRALHALVRGLSRLD
jgi:uncharacterized protein with von Willebrand factor type A (vWA) domain